MLLSELPLDLLLHIATATANPTVYASLSLAASRLGRALIQPFDPVRWQNTLSDEQRASTFDVFRTVVGDHTFLNRHLHSFRDQPAFVYNGYRYWYRYNKIHRDGDRPAREMPRGGERYYQNDRLHRDGDRPAITQDNIRMWIQHGKLHRDDNRPAIEVDDGNIKMWYRHGERWRAGGLPVIERTGAVHLDTEQRFRALEFNVLYDNGDMNRVLQNSAATLGIHRSSAMKMLDSIASTIFVLFVMWALLSRRTVVSDGTCHA